MLRHTVAVLRTTIGLTQDEFAALVKRSPRTIQAIEVGRLPLSEELALQMAQATGVDATWLLEGKPSATLRKGAVALWSGLKPGPYNREYYEFYRAFVEAPACPMEEIHHRLRQEAEKTGDTISGAAKALLTTALAAKDIRVAKALVSGPQARIFAREDAEIADVLQQILEQSAGTERANLVRWKIRGYFDSLAAENELKVDRQRATRGTPPSQPPLPVKRISGWFQYTSPRGWTSTFSPARDEFKSPSGTGIVATTYALKPHTGTREGEEARDEQLRQTIFAIGDPRLKIVKEAAPEMRAAGVRGWTAEAESPDGTKIFIQSMFVHGEGLLLVTLEGSNTPETRTEYDGFVRSISGNDEPAPPRGERPPPSRYDTEVTGDARSA